MSNTQYHVPAVSQLYPRSDTLLNPTQFQQDTFYESYPTIPTSFQPSLGPANPSLYQSRFNTLNPTSQQRFNAPLYPLPSSRSISG